MPERNTKGVPSARDIEIGARVKIQRSISSWSQEKLADALGITFQQVQKYENGVNRIAAGRLYDIAQVLSVPVSTFFIGIGLSGLSDNEQAGFDAAQKSDDDYALELLKLYYKIDSAKRPEFLKQAKLIAQKIDGK